MAHREGGGPWAVPLPPPLGRRMHLPPQPDGARRRQDGSALSQWRGGIDESLSLELKLELRISRLALLLQARSRRSCVKCSSSQQLAGPPRRFFGGARSRMVCLQPASRTRPGFARPSARRRGAGQRKVKPRATPGITSQPNPAQPLPVAPPQAALSSTKRPTLQPLLEEGRGGGHAHVGTKAVWSWWSFSCAAAVPHEPDVASHANYLDPSIALGTTTSRVGHLVDQDSAKPPSPILHNRSLLQQGPPRNQ